MSRPGRSRDGGFRPDEVAGAGRVSKWRASRAGPLDTSMAESEAAILAAVAADLERIALQPSPKPSDGFADRVGAAIKREPSPVPIGAAGSAVRRHSAPGFVAALRDSVRVSFGGRRPVTARAGALAMVAVAGLIVLSVGGAVGFGAASVFVPAPQATHRSEEAAPSPTLSAGPSEATQPTDLDGAGEHSTGPSPSPIDNDGGGSPRQSSDPDASLKPGETPRAGESPRDSDGATPSPSPRPSPTPHGGSGRH
jgi:hypothetical protein